MNMSRDSGPRYSLEYLTFMATKKKSRQARTEKRNVNGEEGAKDEWEGSAGAKEHRARFPPTVTETIRDVWKEMNTAKLQA